MEVAQVLPKHFAEYAVYYRSSSFLLTILTFITNFCLYLHKTGHMQYAVEVCHIWSLMYSIMTVKTLTRTLTKGKFAEILNYNLTSILYSKHVHWKMFRNYVTTVSHNILNAVFIPTFWSSLHIPQCHSHCKMVATCQHTWNILSWLCRWNIPLYPQMQSDSKMTAQIKHICQGKTYLSKSKATPKKQNVSSKKKLLLISYT